MTRWPIGASRSETPGPRAATTPQGSWPPMNGSASALKPSDFCASPGAER